MPLLSSTYQRQVIGNNVRRLRRERGEGTKRLAVYLGLPFAQMTIEIERGYCITPECLEKLAAFFDTSVEALLTESDDMRCVREKAERKEQRRRERQQIELQKMEQAAQRKQVRLQREEEARAKVRAKEEARAEILFQLAGEEELLTPDDVARAFGVRTATVYRWIRGGALKAAIIPAEQGRHRIGSHQGSYWIGRSTVEAILR